MTDDTGLRPEDEHMAMLLVAGLTHEQVAEQCDVSTKTVQRRLRAPAFATYVTDRRRERFATTTAQLVDLAGSAVGALGSLLSSENERIRLEAARTALRLGRGYHREELLESELVARIDALEQHPGQAVSSVPEPDDG